MLRKPSCVGIPACELHLGMYISLFSDRNEEMELDLREGLDLLANVARKGEKDAHKLIRNSSTFVASENNCFETERNWRFCVQQMY